MKLIEKERQGIRSAFESILRADYISISEIDSLKQLETFFIDVFNNMDSLLQKQDSFISGRRGTGKTALLLSGYYECIKTLTNECHSSFFGEDKVLPIYIDLSKCNEIFSGNYDIDFLEIHFVRRIVESLRTQIETLFDEKILGIFKKENPALEDLEYIESILTHGLTLLDGLKRDVENKEKHEEGVKLGGKLSPTDPNITAELYDNEVSEIVESHKQIRGLDIQSFLERIDILRHKAGIKTIFVFLDEFSDLNDEEQQKLASLIKKFLGSKIDMYFKISVITDRYNFGARIIIGRDLFSIPLDFNEFVERFGGVSPTLRKMDNFIESLLQKRFEIFCPEIKLENAFKTKIDEVIHRLSREAMGVPRTIGLILQNAWKLTENPTLSDNRIGLSELSYGLSSARRMYYKQFEGAIKAKLIPAFYMDMWSDILEKANQEKAKSPDRPSSHLLIDPIRKNYLNILCENFLLHFLEENRSSKYGGIYYLYCIDYDVCLENNIKFAEEKDEFTAARFIYDTVLSRFDGYFIKEKFKSYKCPKCGKIYEEIEVQNYKVKRCAIDDSILDEIIHKDAPVTEGNFAEVEIKILGYISSILEKDAASAQEIADAIGCSRQKVSNWCSKILFKKGQIGIIQDNERKYYYGVL